MFLVSKNIIGAPKMRNELYLYKIVNFSSLSLLIIFASITNISYWLLFLISLHKVIPCPTIAITIVVHVLGDSKRFLLFFTFTFKSKKDNFRYRGVILRRSHEPMYKTNVKIKLNYQNRQLLLSQSWKSDNFMESNSEKANIAFPILNNLTVLQMLFRILDAQSIFSLNDMLFIISLVADCIVS